MSKKIIAFLICQVFILSAVSKTYFGGMYPLLQLFTLVCVLGLCVKMLLEGEKLWVILILSVSMVLLFILPVFSTAGYLNTLSSLSFLYSILFGYILFNEKEFAGKVLAVALVANGLALLGETFWGMEFVNKSEGYEDDYSLLYKFGLFSDPKSGGFFILIVGLWAYLRHNISLLLIAFISSLFTGVRISTVGLLLPVIDLLVEYLKAYSFKKVFLYLAGIISVVYYYLYQFFTENALVLSRLLTAMNAGDKSNQLRFYFWERHWEVFSGLPPMNWFWGKFGYADQAVGNGAECLFLDLLNNYGLWAFLLFTIPWFVCWCRYLRNRKVFLVCLSVFAVSISGRFGLGFAEGPIYWMIIFTLLLKCRNTLFENTVIYSPV